MSTTPASVPKRLFFFPVLSSLRLVPTAVHQLGLRWVKPCC